MPERPFSQVIQRGGSATGWLAVSPPGARFQIGVFGDTANEALRKWVESWKQWEASAERIAELKASGEWNLPRCQWSSDE